MPVQFVAQQGIIVIVIRRRLQRIPPSSYRYFIHPIHSWNPIHIPSSQSSSSSSSSSNSSSSGRTPQHIILGNQNHKVNNNYPNNPYQSNQYSLHRHFSSGNNNNNNNSTSTILDHQVQPLSFRMISYSILKLQNASTSNAIIDHYASNASFQKLAKFEGDSTIQRDKEDDNKLAKGIAFAQQKGVLDPKHVPQPYTQIDVLGKTPEQVATIIMDQITDTQKEGKGSVIVLCGLSGTGKGTTVSIMQRKLEESGQKVVSWSNGNIFRSVTLLAATWCELSGLDEFDPDKALSKDNLQDYMTMLTFGKFRNGTFDTRIRGLGLELYVSDVQNTILKEPKVSKNIPTVAEFTQGEVVVFAAKALQLLAADGWVVLLEGREQTVNYVPTPHRFTLTLSDGTLIGKRRAAQRLMGAAIQALKDTGDETSDVMVEEKLDELLHEMSDEIQEETGSSIFCVKWLTGGKK